MSSNPSLASNSIAKNRLRLNSSNDAEPPGTCSDCLECLATILIILTFPISVFFCIKIVNQYERAVIFRLGRLRKGGARGPGMSLRRIYRIILGLFFVIPCIDEYKKVDLRLVSYSVPPQELLSKDSVTASVDAVIYFRISNATVSVINVENATASTRLLAMTTLRNVLATKTLSEMLSDRDHISLEMRTALDSATEDWGVMVERVEIKDVRLPDSMQRAMAAEAEATREAKAKIIAAEGEQKASTALRAAALAISDTPTALQLRYLQTLGEISADNNSTIVFPFPVDFMSVFGKKSKENNNTESTGGQTTKESVENIVKESVKESTKEKKKEGGKVEKKKKKEEVVEKNSGDEALERYFKKSIPREKKETPKKKISPKGKK